jgi:hypothetical protein
MNTNSPNQPRVQQRRMIQYNIIDEQHGGLVVSTFAHPGEWRATGRVVWNVQHTNVPALVNAIAFNPQGVESFELLPMQAFFWLEGDYGTVPIGQNGHGLVRMPLHSAPDAMVHLIIPHFRGDRQNLRVTGVQPVRNLWQVCNDPPPPQGEGVMARVEYEERGRFIEEEFYGVYSWNQSQGGALNWGFGRLFCFRAVRGQLDALRATFWQIVGSLRVNPQWLQLYDQTAQQLMAGFNVNNSNTLNRIFGESAMGRQNIAYNDWLLDQRNNQVAASVARQSQINHERSQYDYTPQDALNNAIFDRTAFEDPNSAAGNFHYESGNPRHVYRNDRGEWYRTDDPMDNPNQHRDGNWVEVKPIEPGR